MPIAPPTSSAIRPPLKWAGGKRWQVPRLLPLWQPHHHRRLVEPFCGGLAVALGLDPRRALLNDRNPHLINFYCWIQRGLAIDIEMQNVERLYYRYRARFNTLLAAGGAESAEAAGLFYYLNRTGYNGLCRFNSRGEFNVPFGRYRQIGYTRDFRPYREAFAAWEFRSGDFEAMPIESSDFIYADPPYDVEFTSYAAGGFSWEDQVRAAEWLSRHSGPVVLVNQATKRIENLYRTLGFDIAFHQAPRRISCNGDRAPATEIIAILNV